MRLFALRNISILLLSAFFIPFIATPLFSQPPMSGIADRGSRATDQLSRAGEKIGKQLITKPRKTFEIQPSDIYAEKEGEKFLITKIELAGCESVPAETFSGLVKKYEGRELALSEVDILAKEIEREYLRKGIITAVFIPPQEVKEGAVTLRVVEARMGNIEVQKHKYFNNKILKRYWQIKKGEVLQYYKISRSVQMMNKNPDREVRATLKAGTEPGTTDVILTPITTFPVHFLFGFDMEGYMPTGRGRTSFGARHNNFLGLDDSLIVGQLFSKDSNSYYAYHNIPITARGTSLLYGGSTSTSVPKKEFDQYDIRSRSDVLSFAVHQDLYNKDEYIGEVFTGFDLKDKWVYANTGGTINRDRLRVLSFGANLVKRTQDSIFIFSPEYDQGLRIFGASSGGNPLASNNASSVFPKFLIGAQDKTRLPFGLQENIKVKTQFSSERLTPQEQFSLGGIDSVRGYPPADYYADTAIQTNYELLIPAFFIPQYLKLPYAASSLKEQVTGLVFFDFGFGQRRGETKSHYMLSAGTGIRINIYDQAVLRLEWGFPFGDRAITESAPARFHIAIDVQEKLPQEIARIRKMREEERLNKLKRH